VDLHLKGFEKMGVKIELDGGYIYATAKKLTGAYINFDISSVGATGNLMMAAVLAQGKTTLENAAREPEITALAQFLNKMGAKISGIGTDILEIEGVNSLQPHSETVIPDRIEAATFLVAGAITGGEITIEGVIPGHLSAVLTKLEDAGCKLGRPETAKSDSPAVETNRIKLTASSTINPISATTAVYPGFPTDMQAQWMALMSLANGSSVITDTIYTDRFTHVAELTRFGADIKLDKNTAIITGVTQLKGAPVMSTDLRASASLILAGLAAQGRTDVLRIYHVDRGYEHIEMKLKKLGAEIWREEGTL
jgi:UDP-N-acetylglucosamine 1-carboxyvinyltransferase